MKLRPPWFPPSNSRPTSYNPKPTNNSSNEEHLVIINKGKKPKNIVNIVPETFHNKLSDSAPVFDDTTKTPEMDKQSPAISRLNPCK